jgi:predicted alpha/beta-fold hydrolase
MDLDFRPLPLLGNPHVQTVMAVWLNGSPFRGPVRQVRLTLPDGDRIVLHDSQPSAWRRGGPVAILVHGLGGSHRSGYLERVTQRLMNRGRRVVRLDMRGAGMSDGLARRPYHAGISDDVRAAAAEVHRWCPESPLELLGFSLGGNIVLKLAGEAADRPVPGLAKVAAVNPPIDLEACARLLELPQNLMYEKYFLRDLTRDARRRQRHFPDLPPLQLPRALTLRRFDEHYTAPRSGFGGHAEYYRRASSRPLLPAIPVPALILTARDDPFIAVEPFETTRVPDHVTIRIVPVGGHLGFLGWDGAGDIRWAERYVSHWLTG